MYDTVFELQMLRTLHPELLSDDAERPWPAGTRRSRIARPREPVTTRRLFARVPRFAPTRARVA
jgi:hypothetical protein